ncbi:MAG TPA: hypothetical protein VLH94_02160 [Spirochaetia bacterium]|nr:hypothetical protein [Spirochaetia bacterium]
MKKSWPESLKKRVIELRKEGISYGSLSSQFKVAKSTLHYWLSDIDYPKDNLDLAKENWIKKIQPMGAMANHQKRLNKLKIIEEKTKIEVKENIHIKEAKKAILATMYWAEGGKGRGDIITFANTDPQMTKLFITLLRECYELDESKFRVRVHLHHYHNEIKVKKFWSDLLNVPLSQFGKIYRKKRSTNKIYRKNEAGICFVRYNSMALKEDVMYYARHVANQLLDERT